MRSRISFRPGGVPTALVLACALGVGAQTLPPAPSGAAAAASKESPEESAEVKRRREAVARIRAYADRVLEFESSRVYALMSLVGSLCRLDRAAARPLFLRGQEVILDQMRAASTPELEKRRQTLRSELRRLENQAAACDRALPAEMAAKRPAGFDSEAESYPALQARLNEASGLAPDEPARAASVLGQAASELDVGMWTSNGDAVGRLMPQLWFLRRRAPEAADNAYLQLVTHLRRQPYVSLVSLLTVGLYPFHWVRSPADSFGSGVSYVDGVGLVALASARPDIPRPVISAYLHAAVDVLARPAPEQQRRAYTVAALMLQPKVQEFASERLAELNAVIQALAQNAPLEPFRDEAATLAFGRRSVPAPQRPAAEREKEIESGSYEAARRLASRIEDSDLRTATLHRLDINEVNRVLKAKDFEGASRVAQAMPPGVERAVVYIALATSQSWEGDRKAAMSDLMIGWREAEALADDRTPHLAIAAAVAAGRLDASLALQLLRLAVAGLNREQEARRSDALRGGKDRPRRGIERLEQSIPTQSGRSGQPFDILLGSFLPFMDAAVGSLGPAHLEEIDELVQALDHEATLAEVLPRVAEMMVADIRRPPEPERGASRKS